MAKKNLLSYLNVDGEEPKAPVLLSQDEINQQSPYASSLFEKDYSKYQKYLQQNGQPVYDSPESWDEKRALAQSGTEKVFNSLGQMVGTFGTSLASTVATLGGAAVGGLGQLGDLVTGKDNTDFMDIMVNNPVMQGINEFDKYLKEDLLPTYYTKEQQESLLSAATGTDLLNGVGFLASNIIPNAAVTKLFGNFTRMANAAKAGKLAGVLDKAVDANTITNAEKMILGGVAKYFEKAPAMIGAAVGRLGESSMEAYGTYEQIKESLTAESELAQQELEMYGETDKKIRTPEEIEAEAKRGRDNVFMGNMVLAASDMLQFTRWFKGDRLADSLVKKGLATTLKERTKGELLGSMLKEAGQEAAEEGFQFLLSKGAEKSARGKSFLEGVSEASGELFTTIEGQKSMLLGAVLGGGMGTIMDVYNHKQQKDTLKQLANQLTSVGDANERYIVTPEGKRIVNPELSKIATTFMFYEQQKEKALAEGDQQAYDIAEKMQFSELVSAKMDAGNLEDFIDELKDMGKSTTEEVESMFGELPTRNGKKMTPQEVVFEKIQQAEKVKKLNEGLQKIPALSTLSNSALNQVRHSLLTQEVLRDQITDLDRQIMEVKGRAVTSYFPDTRELFENELLPQDQMELELLEASKEGVLKNFLESQKKFRDYIKQPELAEEVVDKAQTAAVENAVKEKEKETQTLETFIQNNTPDGSSEPEVNTVVDVNGKEYTIIGENEDGSVVIEDLDGNMFSLDKEQFAKAFSNNLVEEETNYEETNDPENNPELDRKYEENPGKIEEDSYKKITQLASSGQAVAIEGDTRVIEEGEFKLNPEFLYQTELFNEPTLSDNIVADPKDKPKIIQFKAEEGEVEDLASTNDRRIARGLEPIITEEQLKSDEFIPIKLTLIVNGRANNKVVNFFHTPDYYEQTATYDKIERQVQKGEMTRESADKLHAANLQKQKEIRSELVKQIKANGSVILNTKGKSEGVLNFNPKVNGTRKVAPVTEIFGGTIDEFIAPKAHNLYTVVKGKKTQIKTKGLEIVTSVEELEVGFKITTVNSKLTETSFISMFPYNVGEMVYGVVTPNGTVKRISPFNKQSFTPQQIQAMAELIYHRLITGEKEIDVKGEQQPIIGTEENPGIIDSLIYVGTVKSKSSEAIASQLVFAKDGTLLLGKTKITKEDPDAFNKIRTHLNQFKSKPQFKMRSLSNEKFGIPIKTEKGWVIEKPTSYANFMFKGDEALIKTALNKTKFLNTYFVFATDAQGNLLIEGKKEEVVPAVVTEQPVTTTPVSDIERIEIPRYFTFGELGGKPGKKAGETIESEKNAEIQENFEKQLKEGDKLIEPNGDVFFYKNGKIVKPNGQPRNFRDIGAFLNGVTIERNAELAALEEKIDTVEEVQTRLNEDLEVTSKISIDAYLNGLHYIQTEDGKYYVIPDSNASGYESVTAKEVTKEQIIKPFRTEAEWKKVGIVEEQTIVYTPKGKTEQTYTIKDNKIFNNKGQEVFKEGSVDRNKIFANLKVKNKQAEVVEYKSNKFVVDLNGEIVSVVSGKIMQWGPENGNRKAILALSKLYSEKQTAPIESKIAETKEVIIPSEVKQKENECKGSSKPTDINPKSFDIFND